MHIRTIGTWGGPLLAATLLALFLIVPGRFGGGSPGGGPSEASHQHAQPSRHVAAQSRAHTGRLGASAGGASASKGFWLKQVDAYGIVAPMALGLLLWVLGLGVIVIQARGASHERSRLAGENEQTQRLLLELADNLERVLDSGQERAR